MKLQDALPIFKDTITLNLRHQDYKRVCEIAEDFTIYATGKGIEKKLRRFNGRETEEAFAQRVALTQCNVPDIFQSCIRPLYKVGRTPASIRMSWEGEEKAKEKENKNELTGVGSKFWGNKTVIQYITQRLPDLDSTDPNSFIVVEFDGVVNPADPQTKAKPYPFEVNSAEAINYIYKNQILQWLIVMNKIRIKDKKDAEHDGEKYIMYINDESITATEVTRDVYLDLVNSGFELIENVESPAALTDYLFEAKEKKQSKKRYFIIKVFEHKIGSVPAKRVGTVLDHSTRGRTCIPMVFAAQAYFEKSIKVMSEFDLTNCLHVFPQKIQYSDPCPGEATEHGFIGCDRGMRPDGKTQCRSCNGTGFKVHTSAQDIIQIRMPKDISEIVSLENVLVYKNPPIDLLEFQKKFGFIELRQAAQAAVYNSDIFTRQEIATTATEKMISLDAVYDTLSTFADTWSDMYVHIYTCIAQLIDLGSKLTIVHDFPEDFKMRAFPELLDDLAKASTSGAPSHIKKALVRDLMRKLYVDSPGDILKIETKERFNPFPGKSEVEIAFIISNGLTTKYYETLYAHFDLVFAEVEQEQSQKGLDFYHMEEQMQRSLIEEKVNEFNAKVEAEKKEASQFSFNTFNNEEIEEEENEEDEAAE